MSAVDELRGVVSGQLLARAADVSKVLRELGVPHALIGGLAVGVHGHPRGTKDVDFLVGAEAFDSTEPFLIYRDELKNLVQVGETDIMSVPPKYPVLGNELRVSDDIPVISLAGLVLMKLDASRARDKDDVRRLLEQDPGKIAEVRDHLVAHAPELLPRLGEALAGF
jgi:hypothetical protein